MYCGTMFVLNKLYIVYANNTTTCYKQVNNYYIQTSYYIVTTNYITTDTTKQYTMTTTIQCNLTTV